MTSPKLLLIGWDAADWKVIEPLMAAGKMPNLQHLVDTGATGHIATIHPPFSPMLWTSIATGKRPFKHGILGFAEPSPDGRSVRPVTNLSRTTKAVWNILNQNHLRSIVIGWWPSHPAEPIDGVMISDHFHRANRPLADGWALLANAVHPPNLSAALAALRVHPDRLVPDQVEPFVPLAAEIDQDRDKRLAACLRTLAECMSIQSAANWLLVNRPWDFFAVYFDSIDHFCHGFMRYHPPRQPWISQRDFDLYHNVVSMAYQFHDQVLGTLLANAGPDTTVILMSDHGFHPDHLRPSSIPDIPAGPAIEHRDLGILAIRGPAIKPHEKLHGPSVLDITPTILTVYGLPVGEDMDGKVLSQAFLDPPETASIPSWDLVPGQDGRHPPHTHLDPVAAQESLEQMIALGYIDRPDENSELAVQKTVRELRYNLGESYQDAGRHLEAHEIFSALCAADPDEQRFAVRLFVSCQALGRLDEMRQIVARLDGPRRAQFEEAQTKISLARSGDNPRELARWRNLARFQPVVIDYLRAQLLLAEKRYPEALAAFEKVSGAQLLRPALFLQTADLYLRLNRWRDALQVCEKALAIDPDNVEAHLGMCRIALRRRKFASAAQSALDALQRNHNAPLAHFLLGRALVGLKEYERAAHAFRAAISFNPNFPEAHTALAALLGRRLGDPDAARQHRRLARRMRRRVNFGSVGLEAHSTANLAPDLPAPQLNPMRPLQESLVIVSGLPRSGTSMLMQMLAAGGMPVLSDEQRTADEDNPRGYLEFTPVKSLLKNADCLYAGRGKVVKIVVPLVTAIPPDLPCRVILSERNLDEILDSQEQMMRRNSKPVPSDPNHRPRLRAEYARAIARAKSMLAARPETHLLVIDHTRTIANPAAVCADLNRFLGGCLDERKMASAIDPSLHRNRAKPNPVS